jgi:histidinol dehydrogenase
MQTTGIEWESLTAQEQAGLLSRPVLATDHRTRRRVAEIVEKVRAEGDTALRELTLELDGVRLDNFLVTDAEFNAAEKDLPAAALAAMDVAIANVRHFHKAQIPQAIDLVTMPGIRCQRISHPIDSVGLYVPAGSAPLPSAAIMLAVPAAIAGCPLVILCTPPRADGSADPAVIAAARRCGVRTIFKVGGAQAIAAMAWGTESIPKVAKLYGPGNAWVTAAKNLVASIVGGPAIDMPAGPSELLVIADEDANASIVASDLLSQAEHGPDSQVILVANSQHLISQVARQISAQLTRLARSKIAARAMQHSRLLQVRDLDTAASISNAYAPEHLILQVRHPRQLLERIRNAGSVFLGPWSPEAAGDYCSGTNHVLPTYGAARSYSGLGIDQFVRHMTVQELSQEGLQGIASTVLELSRLEGLDAHAAAVSIRLTDTLEVGR